MRWFKKIKIIISKKCIPLLLILAIMFSIVPIFYQNTFFAVPEDTFTLLDDARENVSIYLNQTQLAYKSELKEKGNMTQLLKYYCRYLIALDYISNNVIETSNGKFNYLIGQKEYQTYVQTLGSMSREINKIYNGAETESEADEKASITSIKDKMVEFWLNDLSKTVSTELPTQNLTTAYRDELQNIFDNYLVKLLEVVSADALTLDSTSNLESELANDESINKIINSNKNYVGPLSNLFSTMILSIDYWNSVNTTNVTKNEFNNNTLQFSTNMDKLIKKALLEYEEENDSVDEIVIKDSNNILSLLTNTSRVDGKLVIEGGAEANLTELGYIIISAGSTYDPFVSKAGNDLFLETIHQFVSSEEQWNKTTTIIKRATSLKKPIWIAKVSELDTAKSGKETATYRPAYITDMVSIGDNTNTSENLTQFGILKGYMQPSKVDSSTFEYVQDANPVSQTGTEAKDSVTSGIITVGTDTILANNNEITEPVAYIMNDKNILKGYSNWSEMIGQTTNIILQNARLDTKSNASLINANLGMLFVNGLGDIVLADDTIILPAIANPLLYEYSNDSFELEQMNTTNYLNGREYTFKNDFKGYYPYTATFMNHSPEVTKTGANSDKLAFANKKDKNKYIIVAEEANIISKMKNVAVQITSGSNNKGTVSTSRRNVVPININSFTVQEDEKDITSLFKLYELGQAFTVKGIFSASLYDNKNNAYYVKDMKYNSEQLSFFPLIEDTTDLGTKLNISAPITTSARRYIASVDAGNGEWSPTGNFKVDYFVKNYIAEALLGTQYASTMVKNSNMNYEDIVSDTPRRFEIFITGIVDSLLNTFGNIDGVLSMRNAYENKFFALIIEFINLYYPFIALLLLIVIATRFLKNRISLPYILLISLLTVAGFEIYTTWLPTYSTWAYNFFVNDIAEDISWNAIIHQSENYKETYADADRVNANGDPKPYTATITLYQLSNADVFRTCNRLNITETELKSGDIIYIDQNAGIFLQGNLIKMSLDKALSNKTIRGLYLNQWEALAAQENVNLEEITSTPVNKNPYQIRFIDSTPSLDTYYTPLNNIMQSFIDNLNMTTSIFRIQRNTFSYDKDFYKDAFVVNSFINSGLFLDPGNFDAIRGNIIEGSINGDYTLSSIKALIEDKFKYPEDWLGLSNI